LDFQKSTAVETFNAVWELMDKKDRTDYETIVMIHMAHASVYHWSFIGEAVNMARGEWQVSRVYCLAGMKESALYHALRSLSICENNHIGDFDLAFGYEAVARAHHLSGDIETAKKYIALAQQAAINIAKAEDQAYVLSEIASIER
jgi:hypothetical protein